MGRIAAGALAVASLILAPAAGADPGDPFVPHPPYWCPGNDDPNTVGLLRTAGFCEGQTFPTVPRSRRLPRQADAAAPGMVDRNRS